MSTMTNPWRAPDAAPDPITARQLRLALLSRGISLAAVEAAIAALPEPQRSAAQVEWEYSSTYHRTHPLITPLGAALGLSLEDLDAIWASAPVEFP